MRGFFRVCVVGCLVLRASASAFGSTSPSITDVSNADVVETTKAQPDPGTPPSVPPVQTKPSQSDNPLWGIPIKQLSNTRDRPIFTPSRRPPPPAVVGPPPVAVVSPPVQKKDPERPQLSLLGTIMNGNDGFGIFMDQATNVPLRVRIGTAYQGWTLRSIQAGAVTMEKDQASAILAFPKPANDPKAGAGARLLPGTSAKLLSIGTQAGFPGHPTLNPTPPPGALPQTNPFENVRLGR